jgi:DNA-directed RNA polymerase subunit beta'
MLVVELDECGVPKGMALELFRPFVINQLLEQEHAYNVRGANKLIDQGAEEVWGILEDVIEDKYVLLNRAPTLHRLGIQAFRPKLIEGHALQVHPLICAAFNADFDGDQMAIHVPLTEEAQAEAEEIMASDTNLLKPGTGKPIMSPDKDMILGTFWLTKIIDDNEDVEDMDHFSSPNAAISAYDYGEIDLRERIRVLPTDSKRYERFDGQLFETTVGRLLFNSLLPEEIPYVNKLIDSGDAKDLVDSIIDVVGLEGAPEILDEIKRIGFKYSTVAGITFGLDDVEVPEEKEDIVAEAEAEVEEIEEHFNQGLLSEEERRKQKIKVWLEAKNELGDKLPNALDKNGSVMEMLESGARGSMGQVNNMAGMKGLIVNSQGDTLDFPIKTSSKEGHTPIEYFTTTHGSRKGLTDTALKTATAGYLTRRLFDVSQDIVVNDVDCKTDDFITVSEANLSGIMVPLSDHAKGRYLASDVVVDGEVLHEEGDYLSRDQADALDDNEHVESVDVRSPMTCDLPRGVCKRCYGIDHGSNKPVDVGEAVGTIAAQAVGEPGTQLTMRTFHAGGTASAGGDITEGLPRVENLFEVRTPDSPAIIATVDGTVTDISIEDDTLEISVLPEETEDDEIITYDAPARRTAIVEENQNVTAGDLLTDGAADLEELFEHAGKEKTQKYIIREIHKVYERQGAGISRKHIEVIVKQMFTRYEVTEPGDTEFTVGDVIEEAQLKNQNAKMEEEGKKPAEADRLLKGISRVSLSRESFLSAASFQHTTRTLIDASVRGSEDTLEGLKENVILGRLIPAGTGFEGSDKAQMIEDKVGDKSGGDEQ